MVVAFQEGLETIANELHKKGFTVIPWKNAAYADALIYQYTQGGKSLLNAAVDTSVTPLDGMLFVNVHDISLNQIIDILQNRRYSPIFE